MTYAIVTGDRGHRLLEYETILLSYTTAKLRCAELEENLSYINFGNSNSGKVTLLKKLDWLLRFQKAALDSKYRNHSYVSFKDG